MEKNIKLGESYSSPIGSTLRFAVGSFIVGTKGCYCFVKECVCIQGKDGLTDMDGNPIDIDYYAVKVTEEARDKHIATLLKYSKRQLKR